MRYQATHYMQTLAAGLTATPSGTPIDGSAANGTFSASFTTAPFFVGEALIATVVLAALDAPALGAVKIQGCIDASSNNADVGDEALINWFDLPGVSATGASVTTQSVSGVGLTPWTIPWCGPRWIRLVYTWTSGTSRFSATVQWKGINS